MPQPVVLAAKVSAPKESQTPRSELLCAIAPVDPSSQTQCVDDAFARLKLPRRPYLDSEELKECYLECIKSAHPDGEANPLSTEHPAEDAAAEINRAREILANEVHRIAHFLLLETGSDVTQHRVVPDGLADFFMRLSPLFNQADSLAQGIREEASPILKAQLYMSASHLLSKLSEIQSELQSQCNQARQELIEADRKWIQGSSASTEQTRVQVLETLAGVYQRLSFLNRWLNTLHERRFELTPG